MPTKSTADIRTKYKARLREVREKYGCKTQSALAEKMGIPRQIVQQVECGRIFLSSAMALWIKEVTGCSLDELFELVEKEKPKSASFQSALSFGSSRRRRRKGSD